MTKYRGSLGDVDAYISRPNESERHPAIIVFHDIWGLSEHTKDVADRFAGQGYVALAPALYSSDHELPSILIPLSMVEASQFMRSFPPEKRGDMSYMQEVLSKKPEPERTRIHKVMGALFGGGLSKEKITGEAVKAVEFLNSQDCVRTNSIGHVGFCFGGGISFNLACHTKTAACVVFYGENPSPIELVRNIQCPLLGIYGGEDMRINASLDKLVAAMVNFKKDFEMRIYPGTYHAFFKDTDPTTYNRGAADEAWERTLRFFARALRQ